MERQPEEIEATPRQTSTHKYRERENDRELTTPGSGKQRNTWGKGGERGWTTTRIL